MGGRGTRGDGTARGGERLGSGPSSTSTASSRRSKQHTPSHARTTSPETTEPLDPTDTRARIPAAASPTHSPAPSGLPARRPDGPQSQLSNPCTTHGHALPAPVAAAPPQATQASRLGWPVQVYLAGRGRGVRREAADSPSSQSPGGTPRKHPEAGRRPVALNGETHWNETDGGKQMEGNRPGGLTDPPLASASRALRHSAPRP
jgi:hypothetical protein